MNMQAVQALTVRLPCKSPSLPNCPPGTPTLSTRLSPSGQLRLLSSFPSSAPRLLTYAVPAAAELRTQLDQEMLPPSNPSGKMVDAAELTLELLEWPRLLGVVSSFAGTVSAKELIKNFKLPATRSESESLLLKTAAAIDLLSILGSSLDFGGIQSTLVKSCLLRLQKGFAISGLEALAVSRLLQFTDILQHDLKTSKEQSFGSEKVLQEFLDKIYATGFQQEATKAIAKTVDEDGNVKDSASSELQRARVQYHMVKTKVQELLRRLLREQDSSASAQVIDGRFCIAVSTEHQKDFPGLLLRSGGGDGTMSYIEPVTLVPLNDKLSEARAAIGKAEYEALLALTKKLLPLLESLTSLLEAVVQLDVIVARGKFSLTYEGSMPTFAGAYFESRSAKQGQGSSVQLRQAYHPLLLYQYKENLRRQKTKIQTRKNEQLLKILPPVPIDIMVSGNTRVVTITGPNTGGKTAAMKTLGLAALMAKSGLYVLAKEPASLPWFDAVFADIGDEQSLSQSLSTFSSHLHRINVIINNLTSYQV